MSDSFEMLVDADVSAEEAPELGNRIVEMLRNEGLIRGDLNGECVLGGKGYLPGLRIPTIYSLEGIECRFWDELRTCGVEPKVGRGFNFLALGPVYEGLTCRTCRKTIIPQGGLEEFLDVVADAINKWSEGSDFAMLKCPKCGTSSSLTDGECKPPLGFSNLSFTFWNWPPFGSSSWKISLLEM